MPRQGTGIAVSEVRALPPKRFLAVAGVASQPEPPSRQGFGWLDRNTELPSRHQGKALALWLRHEIIRNRYHLDEAAMSNLSLNTLQPGESAVILGVSADESLHHRLAALGFRIGKEVRLIRRGWFKGPLQVRIGTTEVIMRRDDADKIRVAGKPKR